MNFSRKKIKTLHDENGTLRRDAELRRQMDSSPGWAPGGSGENVGAAGG